MTEGIVCKTNIAAAQTLGEISTIHHIHGNLEKKRLEACRQLMTLVVEYSIMYDVPFLISQYFLEKIIRFLPRIELYCNIISLFLSYVIRINL